MTNFHYLLKNVKSVFKNPMIPPIHVISATNPKRKHMLNSDPPNDHFPAF